MRTRLAGLLLVAVLSACLNRENVGTSEDGENHCPQDLAQATASERKACITEFIEDLSDGPWTGQATSGARTIECRAEFARDGSLRVAMTGGGPAEVPLFGSLFGAYMAREVSGHYTITDLLETEFFGYVERGKLRNDIQHMRLDGDSLVFEWRSGMDASLTTTELMLTRDR